MELTAYHKWLIKHCAADKDCIALQLTHDAAVRNPQAFDVLALTGDKSYTRSTFYKAANLILNEDEKQQNFAGECACTEHPITLDRKNKGR